MALEDLNIILNTWQWAGIENKDANKFNSAVTPTITKSGINLRDDYLESDFLAEINKEQVIGEFNSEELVPFSSGLSLTFFDHDKAMRTLFKMEQDTTLIKWQMLVKYKGVLRHEFWLYPNQRNYGDSLADRTIQTRWVSVAKEFKEWWSNQPLPSPDDLQKYQHGTIPNCTYAFYDELLNQIFGLPVSVALSREGKRWKTAMGAMDGNTGGRLYIPATGNQQQSDTKDWVAFWNSYERIYANGEENCYDYMVKTNNSMGWVHSFDFSTNTTLIIEPRASQNLSYELISYNDNAEEGHNETTDNLQTYDHIFIFNGRFDGGDAAFTVFVQGGGTGTGFRLMKALKGERFISISATRPNYKGEHFTYIRLTSTTHNINVTGTGTVYIEGTIIGGIGGIGAGKATITGNLDLTVPYTTGIPASGNISGTITGTMVVVGTNPGTYNGTWNVNFNGTIVVSKGAGAKTITITGNGAANSPGVSATGAGYMNVTGTIPTPSVQYLVNYILTSELGYSYHKYGGENDHEYVILGFSNQVPFGRPIVNDGVQVTEKKSRILLIDSGDNRVHMTAINGTGHHRLFHNGVSTAADDELVFSGNYGSAMFYDGDVSVMDYHNYTQTDEFKENFNKFRATETKYLEYTHDGVLWDINKKIKFTERGLSFPTEWYIDKMNTDPINEKTKLYLHT